MDKHRIKETFKFRAAVIWGIAVLVTLALSTTGCGRTSSEHGQFSADTEGFPLGMRPPAGDSTRLLRNAHYLKMMGRPELALRELEAAFQQDPGNIRVMNALALAYDESGEYQRAQKLYQKALTLDVSNQALNNNLCFSYYLAGQWDQAEACFRQSLSRNPQNIMARNNLGLLLCRRGRTEEARRLWQEAEGEIAAQKKLQQVMVALGGVDTPHYAQLATPAAVTAAPLPEKSTPPARAIPDPSPAKPWLSPPEPKPQAPAAAPAKVREPVKVAAKPAPPREAAPAAKPAPATVKAKPATQVAAAAPAKAQSPPAPPKQAAKKDLNNKPAPAPVRAIETEASGGIEVLNGTGGYKLAHQTRSLLQEGGFKVVSIGNHQNFGVEKTEIHYRPAAKKMAQELSAKFFPKSRLETGDDFAAGADIKIILGKDSAASSEVAEEPASGAEKIAAMIPEAMPAAAMAASAPAPAAAKAKTPTAASPSIPPVLAAAHPYLTASELEEMGIDIRNGTPAPDLARKTRTMLAQEGFNVVHIGNHIDFGAEKTIIYYRPGAEKMARNLSAKYFFNSTMEQTAKLPEEVAVKVLLGKDLLQRTDVMAKLDE